MDEVTRTPDAACERFFAPPAPADYKFCYQPKGHDGPCQFEPRRRSAATADDLTYYMQSASAYTSLRVELAHIFGPVTPREGQTWNEAMLARITEKLVERGI